MFQYFYPTRKLDDEEESLVDHAFVRMKRGKTKSLWFGRYCWDSRSRFQRKIVASV